MKSDDINAYLNRGWNQARDAKKRLWRKQIDEGGFERAVEILDELRDHMIGLHPDWPTPEMRQADLDHHIRLSRLLKSVSIND